MFVFQDNLGYNLNIVKEEKTVQNNPEKGHLHPITLVTKQMTDIFQSLGFGVVLGPDVEKEHYNFDTLNIPQNHPARDMWDTFWLKNGDLLRTHTSPMQVRYMEKNQPPYKIIVPGRCYRYEATDSTHEVQFNQMEGLMIDKGVTMSDLKGTLEFFLRRLFNDDKIEIRFRPSYFPFVEPGLEVDMKWQGGWLEIAGAGMVHPQVLKNIKIESTGQDEDWQGFAFGIGIDRVAMLKYKIDDIRLFYGSDMRVLKQF
ncbi:MAG: phenylalanine--tRNA ligase subunit alpha [Candidatus Marinimicrobia bacterium]|nr:phenylalanine--tRNA ligase subunit alpha [Candidatus Neomarinimicrobiota bacterium]